MVYDHRYSRSKLAWYDRYAIWALTETRAGGALLWPSLLLLIPAVLLMQVAGASRFSKGFLLVSGVAATVVAVALLARAIHVKRGELHNERHIDAFWERKWKSGDITTTMWWAMALQTALLIGGLIAIGYLYH